jgi:hypothetical protein
MTKKIKPQRTQRAQRGIRRYGEKVSVTSVLSVVFEPIPENIEKSRLGFGIKFMDLQICASAVPQPP